MNVRIVALVVGLLGSGAFAPAAAQSTNTGRATPPLDQVTQVSTGGAHTCARRSSGDVQCWGINMFGQIGNGDSTPAALPVTVIGLQTGMAAVSSGITHNCALTQAGGAKCWGNNPFGQIGDGTNLIRNRAVDVSGLTSGVAMVLAAGGHSCALTSGGTVKCWGSNTFGQLGTGTSPLTQPFSRLPVDVIGLGPGVRRIALGFDHGCAILASGGVRCWGRNDSLQLGSIGANAETPRDVVGLGGNATALALGRNHSCALLDNGRVRCWGGNSLGQLGDNTVGAARGPGDVLGFDGGVTALSAGALHTCALLQNGTVRCWGANFSSQLGENGGNFARMPVEVANLGGSAVAISAGGREEFNGHSCAVLSNSTLKCWGNNSYGQLGIGTLGLRPTPARVSGFSGTVLDLDGGAYHTCLLSGEGAVKCWGFNARGQLGDGTFTHRAVPTDVLGLSSGAQAIVTGGHFDQSHTCVLMSNGSVQCWGANNAGQLGDGTTAQRTTASAVTGLNATLRALSAGDRHTCGVTSSGGVKCWGSDQYGQLGRGSTPSVMSTTPVDVQNLSSGVRQLVTGSNHNCVFTDAGGVKCWGRNNFGQLGNGTTADAAAPVDVVGLPSDVTSISIGSEQSCAVTASRAVYCWGRSDYGQLGEDSGTTRGVPQVVAGLGSGVAAISSRGSLSSAPHSCALGANGAVRCWGFNGAGMLGDGTTLGRPSPEASVAGLANIQQIKTGGQHVCAVGTNGALRCWGDNTFGQLGNGEFGISATPVAVVTRPTLRDVARLSRPTRTGKGGDQSLSGSTNAESDASGSYVVFQSDNSTLVSGDSNGSTDVFVINITSQQVSRVSVDTTESQITSDSIEPSVSADGRLVVFVARDGAVDKLHGESKQARAARHAKADAWGVYLRDLLSGTTQRVGGALSGGTGTEPVVAEASTAVAFTAVNTDAALGAVGQQEVFVASLTTSAQSVSVGQVSCVSCKSVAADGSNTSVNSNGASNDATISADGQTVAWVTAASNSLASSVSPCSGVSTEVMLRNLVTGSAQRMSAPTSSSDCGTAGQGSSSPELDYSGTTLVFQSTQPLVSGDSNSVSDVFVVSTTGTALTRVSAAEDGSEANAAATAPSISGDGKTIAFVSTATNLDPSEPDNNAVADLHMVSLRSDEVQRISQNSSGVQADDASLNPALNYSGKSIAFDSSADNLETGAGDTANVYQRSNPLDADYVFSSAFE